MRRQSPHTQAKPQYQHDEYLLMPLHDVREGSHTLPLYSSFSAYTPPSDASMSPYGYMHPFMPVTSLDPCPAFLHTTAATTLPPMSRGVDDGKGVFYDDTLAPGLNYGFVPSINIDASHHYDTAAPHVSPMNCFFSERTYRTCADASPSQTPPLSQSFDHSANCSEAGFEYPTTPLSMPASPPSMNSRH